MNQIEMDSDDKEKRWKEANTTQTGEHAHRVPSGGIL